MFVVEHLLALSLFIGLIYGDGDCPSGKVFKCNYEKCCDGTQYCSEADQMCRDCIEENCFSPNYEPMCKTFCDEIFPTSIAIVSNSYQGVRSSTSGLHGPTQTHDVHDEDFAQWLPQTAKQKGFVAIVALACPVLVIICWIVHANRGTCVVRFCRRKRDDKDQMKLDLSTELTGVPGTNAVKWNGIEETKITMANHDSTRTKDMDTVSRDSGRSSENNTPVTRRHSNSEQFIQSQPCSLRISNPQNERQGSTNSTALVPSGN